MNHDARTFLRHTLATLAYRGGKTMRDLPAHFATYRAGTAGRTAGEILAHMGDLLEWSGWLVKGEHRWRDSPVQSWDADVARFFDGLRALDDRLASDDPLACPAERLFQGPIADALTHVGQLAMLRRLAGHPCRGENYYVAEITAGRVGREQAAPRREFD
jgi:hypothetical protein